MSTQELRPMRRTKRGRELAAQAHINVARAGVCPRCNGSGTVVHLTASGPELRRIDECHQCRGTGSYACCGGAA